MDWSIVLTVIASAATLYGGLEGIKYLFNRRAYARKENASARDAEVTVHEKQIERYETRLASRDAKVDAVYRELREAEKRELALVKRCGELEVEVVVLKLQKCEKRGCTDREPPGAY